MIFAISTNLKEYFCGYGELHIHFFMPITLMLFKRFISFEYFSVFCPSFGVQSWEKHSMYPPPSYITNFYICVRACCISMTFFLRSADKFYIVRSFHKRIYIIPRNKSFASNPSNRVSNAWKYVILQQFSDFTNP